MTKVDRMKKKKGGSQQNSEHGSSEERDQVDLDDMESVKFNSADKKNEDLRALKITKRASFKKLG